MSGSSVSGSPARGSTFARGAALVLLGFGAFQATAAALRAITPWPEDYGLRPKRDWFVERKDQFDILFVGSSRMFRGIDPRIVDAELARAGVAGEHGPLRSFNFGVGGMLRFESAYVLDELLAEKPARLRVVVMEGEAWDPTTDFLKNTWSSRSVFWHDWERTRLALHSVALMDLSPTERLERSWLHLQLCGMKLFNMGQGARIVTNLLGESRDPFQRSLTHEQIAVAAGYQPYEDFMAPGPSTWEAMLANDPGHGIEIQDRVRGGNERAPDLAHYNLDALEGQKARVHAAGATFVVLLNPGDQGAPEERALAERGDVEHLLDYNRPDLYPVYWAPKARIDDFHLSRTSAEELSKAVAAELARILRPGG